MIPAASNSPQKRASDSEWNDARRVDWVENKMLSLEEAHVFTILLSCKPGRRVKVPSASATLADINKQMTELKNKQCAYFHFHLMVLFLLYKSKKPTTLTKMHFVGKCKQGKIRECLISSLSTEYWVSTEYSTEYWFWRSLLVSLRKVWQCSVRTHFYELAIVGISVFVSRLVCVGRL